MYSKFGRKKTQLYFKLPLFDRETKDRPWKGEPLTEEFDFLLRVKGKVIIESSCLGVTGYY